MREEIAERLKIARIAADYKTARAAAETLGVPYPTYAGHENGNRGLEVEAAMQYARRYHVTLNWLLLGQGPGPKEPDSLKAAFAKLSVPGVPESVRTRVVEYVEFQLDRYYSKSRDTLTNVEV